MGGNRYRSCRYKGKRMRKHRAIILAIVQGWGSMKDEEISEYMASIVVHHINGNKTDNRRCNLRIMTAHSHKALHAKRQRRAANGRFTNSSQTLQKTKHK